MFKCGVCEKVFTVKSNMLRHTKSHEQIKFQCTHCKKDFTRQSNLADHIQKKHGFIKYSAEYNLAMGITVRQPSSDSNTIPHTSKVINQPTPQNPIAHSSTGKRKNKNDQHSKIKFKKTRMGLGNTPGFNEIDSSLDRTTIWYYKSNVENMMVYQTFRDSFKPELVRKLNNFTCIKPIKYNLKLEATYSHKELPSENRSFKTSAREPFSYSDISTLVDDDFAILFGFTLSSIDGLLLGVYEYTPMGGSSYIPLPESISNKKGVINPQNIDECCFKWAILARHASGNNRFKVDVNYFNEEHRYDFSGLSFPTPISEISIFEQRNDDTTVNIYGLKFLKSEMKHIVYPLRVVELEKSNHFDLLVLECDWLENKKTLHEGRLFICKRCFTGFDERIKKCRLSGKAELEQHMKICGLNKPILPILPLEGSTLKFKAWEKAQRVPFIIGVNTKGVHTHTPMSYGFLVKTSDDVPLELLERYNIPQTPIIFRGSESENTVAKNFVSALVTIADRLSKLLKSTNVPIVMTEEQRWIHNAKTVCDFCKTPFGGKMLKVADHNHLTGIFRHTLCTKCNLNLRTVDFVPCFMHNLSAYDAHFIVTELGYDTNKISLIPNSEENYVSFSKRVNDDFTIRFLDSCRFMASNLESLAKNLTTSDLAKFRETAKVFQPMNMPLVTRKGVFPYEYCDKWSKLEESTLPSKLDFYSALTETHVSEDDYSHATKVWDHFNCTSLGGYTYYFTAPGFTFDCMLKYTSISLELLTDYDMILMMEDGIRGGLVQASERYCKANNPKTEGYDSGAPPSWLVYQDSSLSLIITDSLVYRATTEDFYKDLIDNPILLNRMDTLNLPRNHPCYVGTRARVPGLFKDETEGRVMSEFIALRAKSYSYKIAGRKAIVAKGIRGHVVRNHLTFEDHKRCLFEVNDVADSIDNEVVGDDDDDYDDADYDFGGGDDEEWKDREMKRSAFLGFQSVIKAIHQNATTTTDDNHSSTIQLPPYTTYTPYRVNMSIRSFKHQVKTIKSFFLLTLHVEAVEFQ
ncbi:hypothetical protein QTP88_022213 [Uroleucon formosanum]